MGFVMAEIKPKIGAKLAMKSNLKSKMLEYGFDLEEVQRHLVVFNFVSSTFVMKNMYFYKPIFQDTIQKNNLVNQISQQNNTTFATCHLNKISLHQKKQPDLSYDDMFTGQKFDKTDS